MNSRLPSLNGLRAFEAAARHMSFTLAAAELNVTQTAISHQIRRLEEELGVRLFARQNRSLELTPEAREYLPGIRAAFNDLRLATDRLKRKDNDRVLTVSTLASLAAKWLLPRLSSFQQAHPTIDVRITTSTSLVDFRRDDVDAAIRYGRGHWPGEYVVNAMLYRSRDRKYPVGAQIKVSLQNQQGQVRQALASNIELTFEGQETTVFRFRLDENGDLIADSMNRIHKNLRTAGRS